MYRGGGGLSPYMFPYETDYLLGEKFKEPLSTELKVLLANEVKNEVKKLLLAGEVETLLAGEVKALLAKEVKTLLSNVCSKCKKKILCSSKYCMVASSHSEVGPFISKPQSE